MNRYADTLLDSRSGDTVDLEIDLQELWCDLGGVREQHDTLDALQAGYAARLAELLDERPDLIDTDNQPPRVIDLRAWLALEPEPPVIIPDAILAAREALDGIWEEWEASGLDLVIGIDSGGDGRSRMGGDPDLPVDFEWPGERVFVCQIDCTEVAPLDPSGWLPRHGMLYLFTNYACTDPVLLYSDAAELAPRPRPPGLEEVFNAYRYDLKPRTFRFYPLLTPGPWASEDLELPDEVLAAVRDALGLPVEFGWSSDRLLGEPDGELGPEVFAHKRGLRPLRLVLQLSFVDGFLYAAVPPGDLPTGRMDDAVATYWGT